MSKPTAEQLEEVRLSGGAKQISFSRGGCQVVDKAPSTIQNQINAGIREGLKEVKATRAGERLKRLKEEAKYEPIRKIEVEGDPEPWFVKKGSFPELIMTAKLAGRDEKGVLNLDGTDQFAAFIAALLRTFVVVSEEDKSPYFESLEDARAFVDDGFDTTTDVVSLLFYGIIDFNPAVYPEGSSAAKKVWAALMAAKEIPSSTPQ